MSKLTFRGGTHPYDGKDISKDRPVKKVLPKKQLVFPMSQHIGAPAEPAVEKGDKVFVGTVLGKASGFISANVISSVSGEVVAVEPRLTVSGSKMLSVVVENDEEYTPLEGLFTDRDAEKMSKEEIRQAIKDAGIVGMGGAGFPTHVKLTPKNEDEIEYVLVNGAECEPYLTSDYRMMMEVPEQIVAGLKVILKLFDHAKGIIAVEDNKLDAVLKLQEAAKDEDNIEIKVLKTKYPQGAERQLIYASTGRKMNSKMLPADAGCVVDNIDTVISIYQAVCKTTPLIRRIVTVTGDAIETPQNFEVKTGMSYAELLEEAGGFIRQPEKIISGGPMMGIALFDLHIPITKTSSALLAFTKDMVSECEPTACIRCGRCVSVCPSRLIPQKMMEYSDYFDDKGFEAIHGMECYECGTCTYVCPAKRRLTQSFKQTRRSILDNRRKEAAK